MSTWSLQQIRHHPIQHLSPDSTVLVYSLNKVSQHLLLRIDLRVFFLRYKEAMAAICRHLESSPRSPGPWESVRFALRRYSDSGFTHTPRVGLKCEVETWFDQVENSCSEERFRPLLLPGHHAGTQAEKQAVLNEAGATCGLGDWFTLSPSHSPRLTKSICALSGWVSPS